MLEALIKRDRFIVVISLIFVTGLSWLYLLTGAGIDMEASSSLPNQMPSPMEMAMAQPIWSFEYAVIMSIMWWVMMIAMMLPSAAPMILLFSTLNKGIQKSVPTLTFAASYLLIWGVFSLIATALQWFLNTAELLDPMMASSSHVLSGGLLAIAGIYQFTPIKDACLRHCRTPVQFVLDHWKPGCIGAFKMGLLHGMFCLGCCWFLMALLFVGGVMNMFWISGLAVYVLIEKQLPYGPVVSRITGALLLIWGVVLIMN